jgi:hypothetical protein
MGYTTRKLNLRLSFLSALGSKGESGSIVYSFGLCGTIHRPRQRVLAAQDRATRIDRRFVQHFLNTDQLIVLCQPI